VNPFRGSAFLELFSTHPSMQHRIERLRKIGQQMGVFVGY
jgi:Zn-dependent protease with chaperone function